jgi:hypothetical protein
MLRKEEASGLRAILSPILLLSMGAPDARGVSDTQLDGHWAKVTRLESITDMPIFGDIKQKTEVVSLLEMKTSEDGELRYRERTCKLTSKTFGGMVKTSYPPAFLRMLERGWTPAFVEEDGDRLTFIQEKKPRDYGKDGRDQDGDGNPGVTIRVSGIIGGEIYAAIREWSTSLGRMTDENTIEGRVEWDVGLRVLGGSSKRLSSQPDTRRNDDPDAHTFVMRRVRANADCRRLLDQLDDVF